MKRILIIAIVSVLTLTYQLFSQQQTATPNQNTNKSMNKVFCIDESLKILSSGDIDLGECIVGFSKSIVAPNNRIQFYLYNCDRCSYFIDTNSVNTVDKVILSVKWTYYYKKCSGYIYENPFKRAKYVINDGLYINVYATNINVERGAKPGPRSFMQQITLSYSCF